MTDDLSSGTTTHPPGQARVQDPWLVPTYVRQLCYLAARCGLEVGPVSIRAASQSSPACLVSVWTGAVEQFARTGLFTGSQRSRFARGVTARRHLSVPANEGPWGNPLLSGELTRIAGTLSFAATFNCVAPVLEKFGDAERMNLGKEILWYGTSAALAACGIDPKRLPTGPRPAKSRWHAVNVSSPRWRARRLPWGAFLYRVESATALAIRLRRCREQERVADTLSQLQLLNRLLGLRGDLPLPTAKPTYLRLVVDNSGASGRPLRRGNPPLSRSRIDAGAPGLARSARHVVPLK